MGAPIPCGRRATKKTDEAEASRSLGYFRESRRYPLMFSPLPPHSRYRAVATPVRTAPKQSMPRANSGPVNRKARTPLSIARKSLPQKEARAGIEPAFAVLQGQTGGSITTLHQVLSLRMAAGIQ